MAKKNKKEIVLTEACMCGHAKDEHGGNPDLPGSTACTGVVTTGFSKNNLTNEPCDCCCYEEDEEG